MHYTLIGYFLFIFVLFVVLFFVFVQSVKFVVSCHWCFVGGGGSCIKNLDIFFNKIPEIRVKNTYCEPVCN